MDKAFLTFFLGVLACQPCFAPLVLAQEVPVTDVQRGAELCRFVERWGKTNDPEEEIAALEAPYVPQAVVGF